MIARLALAAGAMLAATSAQAQYAPYPQDYDHRVAYRDVPSDYRVFGGARIEARIAYDMLKADLDGDSDFVVARRDRDGLGYGVELGYDLPVGPVVLGAYGGAEGSTINQCAPIETGGTTCFRVGRAFTAGGRIGVPIGASTLLYAKGGYSNAQLRASFTNPLFPATNVLLRRNVDGFHVGGGVESALSGRTYGKLEYVYTRLRNFGADVSEDIDGIDFDRQQVLAAVGVRF